MDKYAVVNASPLIFFSRSHNIELLRNFAHKIFVPEPVATEIKVKRSISAETALRLAGYFGNSAQFWINIRQCRKKLGKIFKNLVVVLPFDNYA